MQLPSIPTKPIALLLRALLLTSSLPAAVTAATVTLSIIPQPQIPNPNVLPASTHATLTSLGVAQSAPLTASNTFVFRNATPGSYLCDIHCATHGFAPLRVDVIEAETVSGSGVKETEETVKVWETFRGNDWANKGEELRPGAGGAVPVLSYGPKVIYVERSGFSILSILKNPMILMGIVSLALFIGMPKLVANMDDETRAEFEEQSRKNPMNSIMSGPQSGGQPGVNFDIAGYLAGQKSTTVSVSNPSGSGSEAATPGNGSKKGGKK